MAMPWWIVWWIAGAVGCAQSSVGNTTRSLALASSRRELEVQRL
jgi:hypothetical protein